MDLAKLFYATQCTYGTDTAMDTDSINQQDDGKSDGSSFLHPESSLPSNRAAASDWSKERSFQQLELSDVHPASHTKCGGRLMECLVARILHVVDISIGIALLVYGSLLCTQFTGQSTAMAAVLFCLMLGTIHLAASLLGVLSLFTRGCSRFGLLVSGFVGPYLALVYATMLISLIFNEDGFVQYLDDHKEVMFLGQNVADNVRKLMPLFYTILSVLGLLEAVRFSVLLKLRANLLRHAEEEALIPRSNDDATLPNTLAEALLEGDKSEMGDQTRESGVSGKETTGTPNWWDGNGN